MKLKVYEVILIQGDVERSLGILYKDEKKAFAEKAMQNNRRDVKNDEYAPYQVRERNVL